MDPIDLSPTDLTIVRHILRRYVPEREVVAFGSRATWTTRPGSDLDLAVLGETPLSAEVMAAMKDAFDESSLTFAVDIVDWAATKESFRKIIRRDQILVKPAEPPASREDWQELTIGDVADVFDGPHATPPKVDAGPIFLGISNLVNGRLDLSEVEHISSEDYERWTRRVTPRANDVVFSYETRLGDAARIPEGLKCCLGRRMGLLRPKSDRVDPRFLLYAFLGPDFQNTIRSRTIHGSTVDRIPLVELPRFPIRIPKRMSDQRRIAEILGALDDKIELNRRMNETLEAIAADTYESILRQSDPESLSARQTKGLTSAIEYGLTRSASERAIGPRFLRITDIQGGKVDWSRVPFCEVSDSEFAKYQIRDGDIFVARTGASTGENTYAVDPPKSVFASYLVRFRFADRAVARWVAQFMRSAEYFNFVEGVLGGSAQPNASAQKLAEAELRLPESEKVQRFYVVVRPLDERKAANVAENETLAQLRDTLLPKLLSGELRVPAAEKELAGHV